MNNQDLQKVYDFVRRFASEQTNPILVTAVIQRIHMDADVEAIRARYEMENRSYKATSFLSSVPGLELVGQIATGFGSCYVRVADLPVTLPGSWLPWWQVVQNSTNITFPGYTSQQLTSSQKDILILFLQTLIDENGGRVLSSEAGTKCLTNTTISPLRARFSSFGSMISALYPDIIQVLDAGSGAYYIMNGSGSTAFTQTSAPAPVDSTSYPMEVDPADPDVLKAIQEMHAFAFMGYWSSTAKELKRMTDFAGANQKIWCAIVAVNFKRVRDEDKLIYLNTDLRGKAENICLFNTQLQTLAGNTIYAVLVENPLPDHQPWVLEELTYKGKQDSIFESLLPEDIHEPASARVQANRRLRLIKMLSTLRTLHEECDDKFQLVSDGYILSTVVIQQLQNYLSRMSEVSSSGLLSSLLKDKQAEAERISELCDMLGKDESVSYLEGLEEAVSRIVQRISDELRRILSIDALDEKYPTGACKSFFEKARAEIQNGADLNDYLDQYKEWVSRICSIASFLWAGDKSEADRICTDFGQPPALMGFISDTLSKDTETSRTVLADIQLVQSNLTLLEQIKDHPNIEGPDNGGEDLPAEKENLEGISPEVPDETEPGSEADFNVDELLDDLYTEGNPSGKENGETPAADTPPSDSSEAEEAEEEKTVSPALPDKLISQCPGILKNNDMDSALRGDTDPDYVIMEFGPWNMDGDSSACSEKDPAYRLLVSPSSRNWGDVRICIYNALSCRDTSAAADLLYQMPDDLESRKMSFMLHALKLIHLHDENISHAIYKTIDVLESLLTAHRENGATDPEVAIIVLTFLPHIISRMLQIDASARLFDVLAPGDVVDWTSVKAFKNSILDLKNILLSEKADPDYLAHINVTNKLKNEINRLNQSETKERLKAIGEQLRLLFENSNAAYGNARKVLRHFPKTGKTKRMLDSLIEGELGKKPVEPFADDEEMLSYIQDIQEQLFDVRPDEITGGARGHLLGQLNRLNDAYKELLNMLNTDSRLSPQAASWYHSIIHSVTQSRGHCQSQNNKNGDKQLLRLLPPYYEKDLFLSDAAENNEIRQLLLSSRLANNGWPEFEEDQRIIALIGLLPQDKKQELSVLQSNVSRSLDDDWVIRLDYLKDTAVDLLRRCYALSRNLADLQWANAIDSSVFGSLLCSLSRNTGWLTRMIDKGVEENRSAKALLFLLRSELEVWFADKQIDSCIQKIANGIIQSVSETMDTETCARLSGEISQSAADRDIRGLMDRFSDSMTESTTLRSQTISSDLFFSREIHDAILNTLRNDYDWSSGRMKGIKFLSNSISDRLGLAACNTQVAEVQTIAKALDYLNRLRNSPEKYAEDSDALEAMTAKIIKFFDVLGFKDPLIELDSPDLWLTFGAQDRSICTFPELGRGIMIDGRLRVRYRIQVMENYNQLADMLTRAQADTSQFYSILLCPFTVSFDERKALFSQSRQSKNSSYFLLDRTFIRFVIELPQRERLKAFYECCTHLIHIYPYSVNTVTGAGFGIFYGRGDEINQIMNTPGASVIYGGRRLGKTSIMREIEWRWQNQSEKNLAVYLDLKNMDVERPEISLWYLIAKSLSSRIVGLARYAENKLKGMFEVKNDAQKIIDIITAHLQTTGGRLLLLLDESDNLIYRDTVRQRERPADGSRLSELTRLISISNDMVKIVIAGLDRVTRFVRSLSAYSMQLDPNAEIFQRFNSNIPLTPMIGNDMQFAYDLVDIPFRQMGYIMERRSIIYILRVCCFRPNLIQNYCSHILSSILSKHDTDFAGDTMYIQIPHDLVYNIYEGKGGDAQFHQAQFEQSVKIPLNVGVTKVYAPVTYAVALMSIRDTETGMFTGFVPGAILTELLRHNGHFADNTASAVEYLTMVLNDLTTMGVLRRIHVGGSTHYALFSHYMLKMLGDETNIRMNLEKDLAVYVDENSSTSEELREMYADRLSVNGSFAPMTIGQLESLRRHLEQVGVAVVTGSEMLRLNALTEMLSEMSIGGTTHRVIGMTGSEFESIDPECIFPVSPEGPPPLLLFRDEWRAELVWDIINMKQQDYPDIMAVFVGDAPFCFRSAELLNEVKDFTIQLTRLERSFRDSWFKRILEREEDRFGSDSSERHEKISRISELTGNWPLLTVEMQNMLQTESDYSFEETLEHFQIRLRTDAESYCRKMGLHLVPDELWEVISNLSRLSECKQLVPSEYDDTKLIEAITFLNKMNILDTSLSEEDSIQNDVPYRVDQTAVQLWKLWKQGGKS